MYRFESWGEFLAMGGHGWFVWGAYAASMAVFAWLVAAPLLRSRAILDQVRRAAPPPLSPTEPEGEA
ncbi:MAG: hypothetical protein KatS3mg124_0869 [Porticoccaceae bacterium]|nr:MAG: hypothetical protein KatS3mg124_0869 [Porticoccaceae bacterium]